MGPLPRRRKMPRQQQPDAIRLSYYKAILPHLAPARAALERVKPEILRLLEEERRQQGKMDASRPASAARLVQLASERAASAFQPRELEAVAKQFGKRTSDFQQEQLDRQVRAAMSVPLNVIESPIVNSLDTFARENVALIKTVPERYFDRIQEDVQEAFESGMHPDELSDLFEERYDMAENDAMRIVRDQIGKLNGELNRERQEAMGVSRFIWRTVNDNRVRDEHAELDGEEFEWANPPIVDGEAIIPGSAIQCRCFSEPLFSDLLESSEE